MCSRLVGGLVAVAFAILLGATAQANPISVDVARAKQVPGTLHVQLTYAFDGSSATPPTGVTRDGTALTGSWKAASNYTANTGSGLRPLAAQQLCDCNVSVGDHAYVITVMAGTKEQKMPVSISVVSNLGEPKDAGVPGGDMQPWDIPEPSQIQGLDCKTACAAPAADQGTAPKVDGGARDVSVIANPDQKVNPPASGDEGGCSLAGGADIAAGLALLLALGLCAAVLRRR